GQTRNITVLNFYFLLLPAASDLNITSCNVRGLNILVKLKQIMNQIRQIKVQVIFLEETHLTAEDFFFRVRKRWPVHIFLASYNFQSRGVITLFHNSVLFKYLIVQCEIASHKLNLVYIYGCKNDNPLFFRNLFLSLLVSSNGGGVSTMRVLRLGSFMGGAENNDVRSLAARLYHVTGSGSGSMTAI
uniref:Endonuclease/exonuclease/phosphatase domain-containing protein n=1 Tax=Maylandia zebra TaxID=106582 RepID=A0A3P9DBU9_9CICH